MCVSESEQFHVKNARQRISDKRLLRRAKSAKVRCELWLGKYRKSDKREDDCSARMAYNAPTHLLI